MYKILTFNIPDFDNTFIEGTIDINTLGDLIQAGLPNISGSFGYCGETTYMQNNGAFAKADEQSETFTLSGMAKRSRWNFDASRSSSIYGNSSTVQPAAYKCYFCIKF